MWGWGDEGDAPTAEEVAGFVEHLGFGRDGDRGAAAPRLPEPRIGVPPELRDCASADDYDRARHGLGSSYMDTVRGLRGDYRHAPDFVVHAWTEDHVRRTLEWAAEKGVSVTPVGGGTSVVGGIEAHSLGSGAIALHLGAMDQVLEIDTESRAARVQAGRPAARGSRSSSAGPASPLRFYPQSFERSTLGGWIATRAGGHFASGPTHIDDLVESVRGDHPGRGRLALAAAARLGRRARRPTGCCSAPRGRSA